MDDLPAPPYQPTDHDSIAPAGVHANAHPDAPAVDQDLASTPVIPVLPPAQAHIDPALDVTADDPPVAPARDPPCVAIIPYVAHIPPSIPVPPAPRIPEPPILPHQAPHALVLNPQNPTISAAAALIARRHQHYAPPIAPNRNNRNNRNNRDVPGAHPPRQQYTIQDCNAVSVTEQELLNLNTPPRTHQQTPRHPTTTTDAAACTRHARAQPHQG